MNNENKPENSVPTTEENVTSQDSIEVNDIKVGEPLHWDGLKHEQRVVVDNIMQQQALVLELSKKFESVLNKDPETFAAVDGLMKSIHDVAVAVSQLQADHQIDGVYRVGIVEGDDDILTYLRIGAGYIAAEENLANMIATAYLDIFTKLTTDVDIINEMTNLKAQTEPTGETNGK